MKLCEYGVVHLQQRASNLTARTLYLDFTFCAMDTIVSDTYKRAEADRPDPPFPLMTLKII